MFSVYFANQAKKFLKNADKILSERIMSKIEKLKDNPVPSDAKFLEGVKGKIFRIRAGDYRILYEIFYGENRISVNNIDKRSKVYK